MRKFTEVYREQQKPIDAYNARKEELRKRARKERLNRK